MTEALRMGVIGGLPARDTECPWMVAILLRQLPASMGHRCGGVLIAPTWVITAAHAVRDLQPQHLDALVGTKSLKSGGVRIPFTRIVIHATADLALLELARAAAPASIRPVAAEQQTLLAPGSPAYVAGWGAAREGGVSTPLLMKGMVEIFSNEEGQRRMGAIRSISAHEICAGTLNATVDACSRDSGGPLVVVASASDHLAGIVSWGVGCGRPNTLGVYVRVTPFADWIATTTGSRAPTPLPLPSPPAPQPPPPTPNVTPAPRPPIRPVDNTLDEHPVNAVADIPDFRDRMYEPALLSLKPTIAPPRTPYVLNQAEEAACTGFGLAATINLLNERQGNRARVSARMLYEVAKSFDEWPGKEYEGSSCRGAIKAWYHTGVCTEASWPYVKDNPGTLTVDRAKEARNLTIGAYYRVRPSVVEYHAALNEAGVVYCSATVHAGWKKDQVIDGRIPFRSGSAGGHAFALVGYNNDGFWVQNSWGNDWGNGGIALWRYEDWQANVYDAWVVQLARPTPQIFPGFARSPNEGAAERQKAAPRRYEVMGHFVHLDDGRFCTKGTYFSNLADVQETAKLVAESDKYPHLLLYAHGGLNNAEDCAKRVFATKDTFKGNGIYPYHLMYDTGIGEEIKDVLVGRCQAADERMKGLTDWSDRFIEFSARPMGRALWREMKHDARSPFVGSGDGIGVLHAFLDAFKASGKPKKIHLVGHSAGGILVAYLLDALLEIDTKVKVETVSLMAPAATVELFDQVYKPALSRVGNMVVYNLSDDLEQKDSVAAIYRKSLLYLVSRAFEEKKDVPLLGMARYSANAKGVACALSTGSSVVGARTMSTSHGGFDNDPATMNDALKRVLGTAPNTPFTAERLEY